MSQRRLRCILLIAVFSQLCEDEGWSCTEELCCPLPGCLCRPWLFVNAEWHTPVIFTAHANSSSFFCIIRGTRSIDVREKKQTIIKKFFFLSLLLFNNWLKLLHNAAALCIVLHMHISPQNSHVCSFFCSLEISRTGVFSCQSAYPWHRMCTGWQF